MANLYIHDDAVSDLEDLRATDPAAASRIVVFLQEIEGNQDIIDRLTQNNYGVEGLADMHVSGWFEQWDKGNNLWRVKLWDLERKGLKYRIVYAFIPQRHDYHVLAIAPRNFNYDERHPLTQRILDAYYALC